MGIRIHKRLGFLLRRPASEWKASRISYEDEASDMEISLVEEFLPWARENLGAVKALLPETSLQHQFAEAFLLDDVVQERHRWMRLCDCVGNDFEMGDPEVVIFRPVGSPEWFRYDNTLDYYQEKLQHPDLEPHVELLPGPIYPYDRRSRIPVCVAAMLLRLGIPHLVGELREAIYTCWS